MQIHLAASVCHIGSAAVKKHISPRGRIFRMSGELGEVADYLRGQKALVLMTIDGLIESA